MNVRQLTKLITPDMVSFWVPGGGNQAIDLIRGNHGQCYGTHPNVPVLPNLINPSVGWHFDGLNDYVDCGNDKSLDINPTTKKWTMGVWINPLWFKDPLGDAATFLWKDNSYGVRLHDPNIISAFTKDTVDWKNISVEGYSTDNYYFATGVLNGSRLSLCVNGVEVASRDDIGTLAVSEANLFIGRQTIGGIHFKGSVVLPFVANKAWSQQQVNNFYLATKGLFAPRG